MDVIRTRQKNWIGHVLRGNSLQREILEGRMEGARGRGRPRQKIMDWMIEDESGKLKEKAQHREEWSRSIFGPAGRQMTWRRSLFVKSSVGLRLSCLKFIHSIFKAPLQSTTTQSRSRQSTNTVLGFHAEAPQATASEGLAQGPYVAAIAEFELATLRTKRAESTSEPLCPTIVHISYEHISVITLSAIYPVPVKNQWWLWTALECIKCLLQHTNGLPHIRVL